MVSTNDIVDRSSSSVSTAPIVLIPNTPGRTYLLIQNPNATIYLAFSFGSVVPSVDAAGNGGAGSYVLWPGMGIILSGTHSGEHPPSNSVNIVASSGTGNKVTASERTS